MVIHKLEPKDLADYLGVSTQSIGNWVNKNIVPDSRHLISLREKFNLDLEDLLYTDLELEALRAIEATIDTEGMVNGKQNNQYSINAHLQSMKRHLSVMQDENNRAIEHFS